MVRLSQLTQRNKISPLPVLERIHFAEERTILGASSAKTHHASQVKRIFRSNQIVLTRGPKAARPQFQPDIPSECESTAWTLRTVPARILNMCMSVWPS